MTRRLYAALLALSLSFGTLGSAHADKTLLNVSYDPTRELYVAFNAAFIDHWQKSTGEKLTIQQAHGGSGAQARAVIDGLEADVVTLGAPSDIDAIADKGLTAKDWATRLPDHSAPYTSTIVFLVRKGNPKGIRNWDDLGRQGVSIVTPNPKTSSGGRWNYLAAWGWALGHWNGDEAKAREFVTGIYKNVAVLDSGARGSTISFTQRGVGDVLLAWENEAFLAVKEAGDGKYDIVVPSESILAEPPVAVVDSVATRKGTQKVAEAYLQYLYSDEGQDIAAKWFYRPRSPAEAAKYAAQFPKLALFTVDERLGGWNKVQSAHFGDGGIFDQIYQAGGK